MPDRLSHDLYDGLAIVFKNHPPPRPVRMTVALLALPLLAVGFFGLWQLVASLFLGAVPATTAGGLWVGTLISVAFTIVPGGLLYGALFMPEKELRIDSVSGTALLTLRSILGVKRATFPIRQLSRPEVVFYPEGSDSFAQYVLQISLAGRRRSRMEYCPVLLPPDEQKIVCERLAAEIVQMCKG